MRVSIGEENFIFHWDGKLNGFACSMFRILRKQSTRSCDRWLNFCSCVFFKCLACERTLSK